ncbi:hypothetical protein [Anaerotignum sp. MB30-C6]|uniref:hypothetical protein n=1 Tax=Anaerotignum sp. MB30-C6 TaxID=3070814 RepID=UPI0027DC0970|nr:hypothetical protein [Anaerotignum sp. MB30-C6]WMI81584.1 hypothetical protein RBQ60_02275 [Anaerotignum sp. MB30-C6]
MKKDNIRDYATEAFRYYAACGRRTSDELKQEVKDMIYEQSKREIIRSGSGSYSDDTAYKVMKADDEEIDMTAEFLDIIAVEKTLMQLHKHQRLAVEIVYFTDAKRELGKGDISKRVHKAEVEIPASTMTIYRWLRNARHVFSRERGLRIDK